MRAASTTCDVIVLPRTRTQTRRGGTSTERLKTGAEQFCEVASAGLAEFFALPRQGHLSPLTSHLSPITNHQSPNRPPFARLNKGNEIPQLRRFRQTAPDFGQRLFGVQLRSIQNPKCFL